jgi:hypothetical protein
MSELLTLELPDDLARRARALAEATNLPLEAVVLDWICQAIAEPPVETLPDSSIVALCDATSEPEQQEQLSALFKRSREGDLTDDDRGRLDRLMQNYPSGLKLKARALKEAVSRGLRSPLADDAA